MNYLIAVSFGITDEPKLSTQTRSLDGNQILSAARVMYSILLQLCNHDAETEKVETTILKQLVQRPQKTFALLQPQIELNNQPAICKTYSSNRYRK